MYKKNLYKLITIIIIQLMVACLILGTARLISLYLIADLQQLEHYSSDIFKAFFLGFRYDLKVAAIAFSLPILFGLFSLYKQTFFSYFLSKFSLFSAFIFFLLTFLSLVNFYYYQTYDNFIDIFIFGLVDDETIAILKTTWVGYPVISILISSMLIAWLSFRVNTAIFIKIQNTKFHLKSTVWASIQTFCFILIIFLFARGSIGTHPLKRYQANVSDYRILNQVTPNAFMLLDWAFSDYKSKVNFTPVNKVEYQEAIARVTGQKSTLRVTPNNQFLENNPPNIVIAVMESMGTRILDEDLYQSNNLLGELRPYFKEDFLFKRFYAETSATVDTLMELLVHSNVPTISHSVATKTTIAENSMRPYKKAGYETIFVYGGNAMWRNLATYLPYQDFDHIFDENNIKSQFPEASDTEGEWGIADDYLFKYTEYLLKKATKPTIITLMTVTNHSPHHAPSNYQVLPTKASTRLSDANTLDNTKLNNMLQTYQYANNSLGDFIKEIKSSDNAAKTIIVATGDHRSRSLTAKSNVQLANKSQVPFYLYIPKNILDHVKYKYEANRVGSHKDLFPTLYNFSLSSQSYTSLGGVNILSVDASIDYWGWSQEGIFDSKGARLSNVKGSVLAWKDNTHFFKNIPVKQVKPAVFSHGDYYRLKTLFINKAIAGESKN